MLSVKNSVYPIVKIVKFIAHAQYSANYIYSLHDTAHAQ